MADQISMCDVSEEASIRLMTLFQCMRLDTGEDRLNKWHCHGIVRISAVVVDNRQGTWK